MSKEIEIYVVGSEDNKFLELDGIRKKFIINEEHSEPNIDFLNPWFCEMTGVYHLWMHSKADYVGLEHYRTYLFEDDRSKIMSRETIEKLLEDNDIICGKCDYEGSKMSLRGNMNRFSKYTLRNMISLLKRTNPGFGEYYDQYLKVRGGYHVFCNVFICKREVLVEWCKFFFNLMVEFEKENYLHKFNTRREGYYAEFMFGAWLEYNGYKIRYSNINKYKKDLSGLHATTKVEK